MKKLDTKFLKPLAKKYVWWKTPEEALRSPALVMAQVMNIGDFDDVQRLTQKVNYLMLRKVLSLVDAKHFSQKSWHYWHYRLGLIYSDQEPPALPERRRA
jgi:hypothetical protein